MVEVEVEVEMEVCLPEACSRGGVGSVLVVCVPRPSFAPPQAL